MLDDRRKRELLVKAEQLDQRCAAGDVKRTELRPLLGILFQPSGSWEERLGKAKRLLEAIPTSWLIHRSQRMPKALQNTRSILKPVLDARHTEEELRFLLGWLARMIHLRERGRRERAAQAPPRHSPEPWRKR
jgi:hypothetical protein